MNFRSYFDDHAADILSLLFLGVVIVFVYICGCFVDWW